MTKKSKKRSNGEKSKIKEPRTLAPGSLAESGHISRTTKEKPIIRAIRVTQDLLDAAKNYKKASGKSFYSLGYEAIRERLVREGFLKESSESKN